MVRHGIGKSLTLHVAVILLVVFGLPHFGDEIEMAAMPIAVEVVSPDQVASAPQKANNPAPKPTNNTKPTPPQPAAKPEPKPEPIKEPTPPAATPKPEPVAKPEPKPPEPKNDIPPPPSEQKDDAPEEQVKEQKKPPVPKPAPQRPKSTPKPETKPEPKPQPKQETKTETTPKPDDNAKFNNLLDLLSSSGTGKGDTSKPVREGIEDSPVDESPNISQLLNGGELDAVRQQVMGCWLEPTGLKEDEQYIVEIKVEVNPDRTVRSAKVVDSPKMRTDPFYRTLGESAVRALYNPRCSPLKLPESKYNMWKTITFRFSPGGVM